MSNKPINSREMALREFIITCFNMTKLASIIFGVSRSKGGGLDYSQKPFNQRSGTLIKPI